MIFYKVKWFKCCFYYTAYSHCFNNFYGFANIFLHISRVQSMPSEWFSFETQKYYYVLGSKFIFKFSYSQSCFDVAQRCRNQRWKWQHCFEVALRCSNQHRNEQRWFDVVQCCKLQFWCTQHCFNVDLTLSDVETSYQPNKNVETTLKCLLGG